jgi:hypothetical protein
MTTFTLSLRKKRIKGETTEEYLKRQHKIDDIQRNNQKFTNPYTWKESYDIDSDLLREASTLRGEENKTWHINRIHGTHPDKQEAILSTDIEM